MKKYNSITKLVFTWIWLCAFMPIAAQDVTSKESIDDNKSQTAELSVVKGQIKDATTKVPLLGARIYSADGRFSAMTDENGSFDLKIPGGINRVYVSAPDFETIEYPIQGRNDLVISLYKTAAALQNLSALTVDDQMQTLSGGYVRTIKRSGAPGIGSSMFIHGYNSLNLGSQPLIIIDGMVFDNQTDRASIHEGFILNPLSSISVEDIDHIEVLKDGTSLYGSKGGNGVILITTKRGKDVVTKIQASGMFGVNLKPKTTPVLNADQYRVYVSDLMKEVYKDPSYLASFPFLNDNPDYYDYKRYHNNNDWSKDVYDNSVTQSYQVDVSGGDDVALYNLSVGYSNANSTVKENDFSRFNARFNSDIFMTKQLDLAFDIAYSQADNNVRDDGFASNSSSLETSPTIISQIKAPFLIPYEYNNEGYVSKDLSDSDDFGVANPLSILHNAIGETSQTYLSISARPTYKFSDELKLAGAFNYSLNSLFEKYFRPNEGVPSVIDRLTGETSNSYVQAQNTKQNAISANLFLNWNKDFDIHGLDLTGGLRYYSDSYSGEYGSGHNTASDLDVNLSDGLQMRSTTGYDETWKTLSWYAKATYSLHDKYFLSASAAADASSRFGKEADLAFDMGGVNWALYPSVNISWLASSENFMTSLPFVNYMLLRGEYGVSGNDNIPHGSTISYFSAIRYINQYSGITLLNIGNEYLKPERVEKMSAGLDLALFNNRLSFSGDVYHHKTSDLLSLKKFRSYVGQEMYWTNDGELKNTGYEVSFNAKLLALRNFSWDLGASIAHYKNEIVDLPDGDYTTEIYGGEILTAVGKPVGQFYGYKTNGVFATTQEAEAANLKVKDETGIGYIPFTAGDVHFVDMNGDNIIDEKDKTVIGDPNPDFTGSFNTRFSYKKLSLSALFSYSYGNDVYNYARSRMEAGGNGNYYNQSSALQNRWVSEGQVTSIPKSSFYDEVGNSRFSDRWIEDGSYLRLKSLSLSYDIPVNSIFLSGVTVWVAANNLWTYSKYLGTDPEFSVNNSVLYQGIDTGVLSQGKSFYLGLKLNL